MHDLLTQADVARWLNVSQEWVVENLQDCVTLRVAGEPRWTRPEILAHLRKNPKRAAA